MENVRVVKNPRKRVKRSTPTNEVCVLRAKAKIVSLNGGIVLAIVMLLTAITIGSVLTSSFVASQTILFIILTVASWAYLLDSTSERMELKGNQIVRSSLFGRKVTVSLDEIESLVLRHEGLNQNVGLESLTLIYQDEREEQVALGPCWRRRDLEAFLSSVEQQMGYEEVVEMQP
ncbi:hypothetical protein GF395_03590 [Candidatus Uhrbacteria bacterium]|nr:hypothetical protein [Candidatus Uhrbacteria bacterium]